MALDIGDASIGIAISDTLLSCAFPLSTIKRKSKEDDIKKLEEIVSSRDIDKLVVGLPLDIEGNIGPQAKKVRKFANYIKKSLDIDIEYIDERFTTKMANQTMYAMGVKDGKKKGIEDALAASYILEIYLKKIK